MASLERASTSHGCPAQRKPTAHDNSLIFAENDRLVKKALDADPYLNVTQIADKTGLQRRIARKHLTKMIQAGEVEKVGAGYALVGPISTELNDLVRRVLSENSYEDWNFPFPHNVAACYLISDPDKSHNKYRYLFEPFAKRFVDSLFWIDDVLAYAVSYGYLSDKVYPKGVIEPKLNTTLLKKAWEACFGDSNLFVFAFAISPPKFLTLLTTPAGKNWATRHLQETWDSILDRVEKERLESKNIGEQIRRSREEYEKMMRTSKKGGR